MTSSNASPEWDDFTAWAPGRLNGRLDEPVGLLAGMYGEPDNDPIGDIYIRVARTLEPITESRVTAKHMDPSVGAGSFGIAAFWEVVSHGADLLAYAVVVAQAAPRIRAAAQKLASLLGGRETQDAVILAPAAIRLLVVADVIKRNGLNPDYLADVQMIRHMYEPPEPREELKLLYAAYTVSVGAFKDDYYCTWVYTVAGDGKVLAETSLKLPIPNTSPDLQPPHALRSLLD